MPSAVVGTHMPRAGYPPTVRPWQRRKAKQIKKLRAPAPRPRAYASLRRAARHTASQRKHSPRHVVTRARPLQQLQQHRTGRHVCALCQLDQPGPHTASPTLLHHFQVSNGGEYLLRRAPCSCCPACARPVDVLSYLASAFRARCASLFQRFPATRAPRRVAASPALPREFERGKSGRRAQREDRSGVAGAVRRRRGAATEGGTWAGGRKARRKRERRAAAAFYEICF